jgi:hypothetical protein
MYDDKYCYFAPLGTQVKLSFNPSFIRKNQRASETNALLIIPAILTGKSQFGHPNCPVRALKYYHRRTRDPAVRKGRQHMFNPSGMLNLVMKSVVVPYPAGYDPLLSMLLVLFLTLYHPVSRLMKNVQWLLHCGYSPGPLSIRSLKRVFGIAAVPFPKILPARFGITGKSY